MFCTVVPSSFAGEPRSLNGVPLVFVPVRMLLVLIALKIQNPSLVNAQTLRRLFGTTRLLSRERVGPTR